MLNLRCGGACVSFDRRTHGFSLGIMCLKDSFVRLFSYLAEFDKVLSVAHKETTNGLFTRSRSRGTCC